MLDPISLFKRKTSRKGKKSKATATKSAKATSLPIQTSEGVKFFIPPQIPKDFFQITGDFSRVRSWRCKVHEQSSGKIAVEDFDEVRYVMFSLKDDSIIPIAISDEHHVGYDLLENFYGEKYKINPEDYYSLCTWGTTYFYDAEDLLKLAVVGEKYIRFGGDPLLKVMGMNDKMALPLQTVIDHKGDLKKLQKIFPLKPKNKLYPYGTLFYEKWRNLSEFYASHLTSFLKRDSYTLVDLAISLTEWIYGLFTWELNLSVKDKSTIVNYMKGLRKESISEIGSFIFSFNRKTVLDIEGFYGLRNYFHTRLRDLQKEERKSHKERASLVFGDLNVLTELIANL